MIDTCAIDIARADSIPGWMTIAELEWLAQQASTHHRIVELGSFRGRSTRALADHAAGTVHAIDSWCTLPFLGLTQDDCNTVWREFNVHLADHLASGKLTVIRALHDDYSKLPPEWLRASTDTDRPDMVFIDGSHDYASVKRDILAWWERLAPGGLLCGHDARNASWPDVDRAVMELLPTAQFVDGTMLWHITKPEAYTSPALSNLTTLREVGNLRAMGRFIVDTAAPDSPHVPAREIKADKWDAVTGLLPATPRLAIAVPSSGRYTPPEMYLATALLQFPPSLSYCWIATKGQRRDQARIDLCKEARELGAAFLLFIDDDTPPPPHTVMQLMHVMGNAEEDVAVVGGIYTSKSVPAFPLVFDDSGNVMCRWKEGEVFECGRIATGCMLIRLSALDSLSEPWFRDIKTQAEVEAYWQEAQDYCTGNRHYCFEVTDDMYFCWKLRKAGFRILAHGGVLPSHWDDKGNCYRLAPDSYPLRKD